MNKYSTPTRSPELAEFMNQLDNHAQLANARARNPFLDEDSKMKAAAARDAYYTAISLADTIMGGSWND